jgi:hypothetical protein
MSQLLFHVSKSSFCLSKAKVGGLTLGGEETGIHPLGPFVSHGGVYVVVVVRITTVDTAATAVQ